MKFTPWQFSPLRGVMDFSGKILTMGFRNRATTLTVGSGALANQA